MKKYAVREIISDEARKELGNTPEILAHFLYHRGIRDKISAEKFLNPDYAAHTHDPFLMKDMEKAVSRILEAVSKNEKIAVWSDYDADGIPGAVILHDFFKKIGFNNFENYIPDRNGEGFGLNEYGVKEIAEGGARILITIDCGTADVREAALAKSLGLDVIISDHHLPSGGLPDAFAILNPKQKDCAYPDKNLCGAGVVFKLVQALCLSLKIENCLPAEAASAQAGKLKIPTATFPSGWEKWLLDMVGIATIADMVPLVGENRIFAYYGLKVLRKSPRVGLLKLFQNAKINQAAISEDDIGFSIAPRINAASRMGIAKDAFNLLVAADEIEAGVLASHLEKINNERKGLVASMVKEMKNIVAERYPAERKIIVLGNPKWKPSLLGLAANALMEEYACPIFIWGREGGSTLKGSCRSDGSVSLVRLMEKAPAGILAEFGGHHFSGGFSVKSESVHLLEESLLKAFDGVSAPEELAEETIADKKMSADEITHELFLALDKASPFGEGNEKPVFLLENEQVADVMKFGKENSHLKIIFKRTDGSVLPAISFFAADKGAQYSIKKGDKINLLANLEKSFFGGRAELRLRIIDIF